METDPNHQLIIQYHAMIKFMADRIMARDFSRTRDALEPFRAKRRLNALNITADYEVIRTAETGLVQIQARMGGTGERFFAGDATLTRAAVRLTDGTLGYSWVLGRDKQHAERCALIDALMQQNRHFQNLSETLITPLDADRMARIAARQAEVNASRVDFFTMVRGDNA